MRVSECVRCAKFPCDDVNHQCYVVPDVEVRPQQVSIAMIAEAAPPNLATIIMWKATSYFRGPRFKRLTMQAHMLRLFKTFSI